MYTQHYYPFILCIFVLFLQGCTLFHSGNNNCGHEMTRSDFDLTVAVLRYESEFAFTAQDELFFLTSTPMRIWSESCNPINMPEKLYVDISDLPQNYRKASEAIIDPNCLEVHDRNTNKPGNMCWVTIILWIDEYTAIVEVGNWRGQPSASANIYVWRKDRKTQNTWEKTTFVSGWDS